MAINDGGAAFPNSMPAWNDQQGDGTRQHPWSEGVSVRDYFAAKAMAAMVGNDQCITLLLGEVHLMQPRGALLLASQAYDFADAMIAVRNKE